MEQNNKVNLSSSMETAAAALAARCYGDPDFAKRLREDPKAAIEETCGKKLPEALTIEVHENDGRTWHVPVPSDGNTGELSDRQLSAVSGGEILGSVILVASLVAGSVVAGTAVVGGVAAGAIVGTQQNRD